MLAEVRAKLELRRSHS